MIFSAKEGITYVLEYYDIPSYNNLAELLSDSSLIIQRGQIQNYLNGTQMTEKIAKRFLICFNIVIAIYESKDRRFQK
jgi:hypothetical protein